MALNSAELAYLDASAARIEEERRTDELRLRDDARSRRRLLGLVAALASALGLAALVLLGAFAADKPSVTFFANRLNDQWLANVSAGLERAERELDMELVEVSWAVDPVDEFRQLAASGPEIVIVSEDVFIDADRSVLTDYPDVQFGVVEGSAAGANVTSVDFANEEGAYLAGVAAASKTQTGTVGFIGGRKQFDIEAFRAGFEAGASSVDAEIEVLAVYVDQFNELNGFGRPDLGEARARALYQRGADVLFAAAGSSGLGMFAAAASESNVLERELWAIGVDNDQWFEVEPDEQAQVLTSVIKRGDLATFNLVEHMLAGEPTGVAFRLGAGDGGFDYSTQSNALTPEIIARLDQAIADISDGRVAVPTTPTGPTLTLDFEGNEIVIRRGVDGIDMGVPVGQGPFELNSLGTPITVTLPPDWWVLDNIFGATGVGHRDGMPRRGDREVWFSRPTLLADPTQPQADVGDQVWWPLDDIEGWLDTLIDGVVTAGPEATEIDGRSAVYFEAEVDPAVCGPFQHCAGFVINAFLGPSTISAWSFDPGIHHRVWWVDGGDEPPLVIIATTPSGEQAKQAEADELLETLIIGEFGPHPVG